MKEWTKTQLLLIVLGYLGLIFVGFKYFTTQDELTNTQKEMEVVESKLTSQTKKYDTLEQKYEAMAHELDSLYYVVDVEGTILEKKKANN